MLAPTINRVINKKKYILDQVKGSVAAYSLDKLNPKATSPCTLSFSDGSPNLIIPFTNGTFDKDYVENYISRNRVVNSTMNIDSNSDGVIDNWQLLVGTGITANTLIDDASQRINITNSTSTNDVQLYQDIAINSGETVNISVDARLSGSNLTCRYYGDWYNGTTYISSTSMGTTTSTSYTTISVNSSIAPPNTTKLRLRCTLKINTIGAVGSAWFKNASLTKIKSFAVVDNLMTDSNNDLIPDGWILASAVSTIATTVDQKGFTISYTTANNNTGSANITKANIPVSQSENVTLRFDYKTTGNINSRYALVAMPSNTTLNTVVNKKYTSGGYVTEYCTVTFPASDTSLSIVLSSRADNIGDSGSVTYKNVKLYRSNVSAYVQQWNDQSGNNNHSLQNTASCQPRILNNGIWEVDDYGKISLKFDGVDDFLTINHNSNLNLSISGSVNVIYKKSSGFRICQKKSNSSGAVADAYFFDDACMLSIAGAFVASGVSTNQNNYQIDTGIWDGINIKGYRNSLFWTPSTVTGGLLNNRVVSPTNTPLDNTDVLTIGKRINSGSEGIITGNISEFILFQLALSDNQRQILERNQGRRYNISV